MEKSSPLLRRFRQFSFSAAILFSALIFLSSARADIFVSLSEAGGNTTLTFSGTLDTSFFGSRPAVSANSPTFVASDSTFNGSSLSAVANPSTRWFPVNLGGAVGYKDFNGGGQVIALSSTFGGGAFIVNTPTQFLELPGDFSSGGIFTLSEQATFAGTPAALQWDTTPFTLSLAGMQSIFFFRDPPAMGGGSGGDVMTVNTEAINSANSTGVFVPNAHADGLKSLTNTALNALHNQRIVRARSRIGNPRVASDTLASSDRHLGKYLHFAARQGMNLGQALGLEEAPASVRIDDSLDQVAQFFSVEVPAGGKIVADKAPLEEPKRWEVYAVGDFGHHDQSALDTVNRGFQSRTWTGNVGVEYLVNDNLNVGVAYTYADNDTDLDEGLGNVDIEGNLASVYATGFFDDKYVDVLYSYGSYKNDIRRNTLTAGGFAQGSPDSDSHTFSINAGQNFDLGDGLVTGPTIGWDYTDGNIDAYNETGGGAAALNYMERDYSSSITSLGWQISKTKEVTQGILSLQGFASWEHEFSPEAGNVRGSLATSPFAVNGVATGGFGINRPGAAPGTDWLTLGLGARLACHSGLAFSFDYQTQLFRDDVTAHYAGLRVTGAF